jgi:hypothetical protein
MKKRIVITTLDCRVSFADYVSINLKRANVMTKWSGNILRVGMTNNTCVYVKTSGKHTNSLTTPPPLPECKIQIVTNDTNKRHNYFYSVKIRSVTERSLSRVEVPHFSKAHFDSTQ